MIKSNFINNDFYLNLLYLSPFIHTKWYQTRYLQKTIFKFLTYKRSKLGWEYFILNYILLVSDPKLGWAVIYSEDSF